MGCCCSTGGAPGKDPYNPDVSNQLPCEALGNNPSYAVAPAMVEEEAVKEVLSETPISKPLAQSETRDRKTQVPNSLRKERRPRKILPGKAEETVSDASQVTEMWSVSDGLSMSTSVSENREADEATSKRSREVGRRVNPKVTRNRPCAGESYSRREQREKYPARRAERSPMKRTEAVGRLVNGKGSGEARSRKPNAGVSGDPPGRRLRSPATGTAGEPSKPRATMRVTGRGAESSETLVIRSESGKAGGGNDGVLDRGSESLENPLVSLECFIFL